MCLSGGHTAQCGGGGMGVNQKHIVAVGHGCATQIIILLVYAVQPNQLVVIWLVRPIRCLHIDNMCEPPESWGAIVRSRDAALFPGVSTCVARKRSRDRKFL